MDCQSAATGGMAEMRVVACGVDQHRGQDRHEAGAAGCPDGLAAVALSPFFFASLALEAPAVVTTAERPILFSAGQLHRPLPQHCRAWQNATVSPSRWVSSRPDSERGRQCCFSGGSPVLADSNAPRRYTAVSGGTESNLRGADGVGAQSHKRSTCLSTFCLPPLWRERERERGGVAGWRWRGGGGGANKGYKNIFDH